MARRHRFGDFTLDFDDRRLFRGDAPLPLNGRYFDALALLVGEAGTLVPKERFMDEVWRGVPVTDEALTQCIRALRKALGDDATRPRFIETVPKHGYRFIGGDAPSRPAKAADRPGEHLPFLWLAGTLGGGLAGLAGGLFYGAIIASAPGDGGVGALSVLLVITCLCIFVALIGAAGVSAGICSARARSRPSWLVYAAGGMAGGMAVGALAKLLGLDAFRLIVGQGPGEITGAIEGAILGAAIGLGAWLGRSSVPRATAILAAAGCGAAGGLVVALLGRPLMAGSLVALAGNMPGSRLDLGAFARLLGNPTGAPLALGASAMLEGALFAVGIVMAMRLAERQSSGG